MDHSPLSTLPRRPARARRSPLALGATHRLSVAAGFAALLWLGVAWAVQG